MFGSLKEPQRISVRVDLQHAQRPEAALSLEQQSPAQRHYGQYVEPEGDPLKGRIGVDFSRVRTGKNRLDFSLKSTK